MKSHLRSRLAVGAMLIFFSWVLTSSAVPAADAISGVVRDAIGPVAGATVRIQATSQAVTTDGQGRFTVHGLPLDQPVMLTAWAPGYYIAGSVPYLPGSDGVELVLVPHASSDNPAYQWLSALASAGEQGNCQNCHADPASPDSMLPFDEWVKDAHGLSAQNPRFLTMYTGTDLAGNQSPPTRYGYNRDYGSFPLPPDLSQPYYGPGYRLDFPATAGNCAACHAPAGAVDAPYGTDPTQLSGVATEGVACDFCHKVWDVRLDPATGTPYENMPGVLSFEFRRPPEGHQFFAGPFDDVAPGEDTYSPLQTRSQFCAPCHFGVFWGTVIYNSFGEWLASPYSDPATGRTCQDCHMPARGATHFARPERGGLERDPAGIFSHLMPGAADQALLQNTAELRLAAEYQGDLITVTVAVANTLAGHHIPTDSPLRQIFLSVAATGAQGQALALQAGPVLPQWAGDLAGLPGVYFAKLLQELWTEVQPTGAYWVPTRIVEDTRLPALATHTSAYVFAVPEGRNRGEITVEARLIFRRAYDSLRQWKGWVAPDILMESAIIRIP
ncbi:MAG: carboxypeptidase regulatory-like domain-containing protein [Deinococcus sp.]|nr:carboxypeptidase regulatory-like domain-containing protein [Deinococcus sp.]